MSADHRKTIRSLEQFTQKGRRESSALKRPSLSNAFALDPPVFGDGAVHLQSNKENGAVTTQQRKKERATSQESAAEDLIVDKVFFQAGSTKWPEEEESNSTRIPLLVFAPSFIPIDLDALATNEIITKTVQRLETLAESDYIAVVFAISTNPTITSAALVKIYFTLSRNVKKNVKRMYIVHPSFWSRMTIRIFSSIVSWKVGKKIKICNSLDDLAKAVDLRQIEIPPNIYERDYKIHATVPLPPEYNYAPIFGASLTQVMGKHGERGVPRVVRECIAHIRQYGLDKEGIFRISPSTQFLNILQGAYDRGNPVTLADYDSSVHLAASLLGRFLRLLQNSIISTREYALIEKCPDIGLNSGDDAVQHLRETFIRDLAAISEAKVILLCEILGLLHEVSLRSHLNKMDARNLAICLAPILSRSSDVQRDMQHCRIPAKSQQLCGMTTFGAALRLMIARYHEIFPDNDTNTKTQIPPATPELSSGSVSVPSSPESSPFSSPKIDKFARSRTTSSNPTLPSSNSSGQNGTGTIRALASGKQSVRLLGSRHRASIALRFAQAEESAVVATGQVSLE